MSDIGGNDVIYVGAKSAFLFIGTRAEWVSRQQDVFERMMKRKRDILHVRELAYRREYNREDCDLKTLKQLKQKVNEAIADINATKPLNEREVYATYPKEGGTVVLIEGTEDGMLWVKDEALEPTKHAPIRANELLLAEAIIRQAAADLAYEVLHREGDEQSLEEVKLRRFFRSGRYQRLTKLPGDLLMKMVEEDPRTVLKTKPPELVERKGRGNQHTKGVKNGQETH